MKKLLLFFIFLSTITQATCIEIDDRYSYSRGLSKGETTCYSYRIQSGRLPVFTLKQKSFSNADFDIYIYDYSDFTSPLTEGVENGSRTELITLDVRESSNYVYIKIKNLGQSYGNYTLYTHTINFEDKVAETIVESTIQSGIELLIEGLFDVKSNSSDTSKRNVSRGSTAIMAYLGNKNFATTSVDLMINEITTLVREVFGYGFVGKLLVRFSISIIRDIYRYY